MMNLPDGRLLGDQLPFPAAQLRHVPEQDQRPHVLAVGAQRDRAQEQRGVGVLDLDLLGRAPGDHGREHVVDLVPGLQQLGREVLQPGADQVGHQTHPPVRRQRVGARERHHSVPIDADAAVTDPWCRGQQPFPAVREDPVGDHPGQIGRALQVRDLQTGRRPHTEQVGVPRDHRDHPVAAPYRDRLDPDRYVVAPLGIALAADPAAVVRLVEQVPAAARDEAADDVVQVRRGAGRRPHLRTGPEPQPFGVRQPEHQVREREVGQHLPVGDQQLQAIQVGLVERRVVARHIGQGRHTLMLPTAYTSHAGGPLDKRAWVGVD
jgi:hypothetical protein